MIGLLYPVPMDIDTQLIPDDATDFLFSGFTLCPGVGHITPGPGLDPSRWYLSGTLGNFL